MNTDINSETNTRKIEHLEVFANHPEIERKNSGFEDIHLIHRAFCEIDFSEIDTSCEFLGKKFSMPLIISSMTGGDHPEIIKINQNIAIAAQSENIGFAVGSQRVMFENPKAKESFDLRKLAKDVFIGANLGAVQLNYGFGLEHCRKAVDILQADALFLHLNPLQEVVQKNGNLNFAKLYEKIELISHGISVPVILKETGCGLSISDISIGKKIGIEYFDIAGRGGTSWSMVEHLRNQDPHNNLGELFQDWGLPTAKALKYAVNYFPELSFIASGGIRSGLDIAKAMIIGADICASAAPFISAAKISAQAVVEKIRNFKKELQTTMFLVGCKSVDDIKNNKSLIFD